MASVPAQCRTVGTAVLTVTQMGVDTFVTRLLTVAGAASSCTIQDAVETRVIPRGPTTATYSCADLTRDTNGALHFLACGNDGDVTVPSPTGS